MKCVWINLESATPWEYLDARERLCEIVMRVGPALFLSRVGLLLQGG